MIDIDTLRAIYGDDPADWPPPEFLEDQERDRKKMNAEAKKPKKEKVGNWKSADYLIFMQIKEIGKKLVKKAGHPIPITCVDGRGPDGCQR